MTAPEKLPSNLDGEAPARYLVFLRADSGFYFAPNDSVYVPGFPSVAGRVDLDFTTLRGVTAESVHPARLGFGVVAQGEASSLSAAIETYGNVARGLTAFFSLAANAAVGEPSAEFAYEASLGTHPRVYWRRQLDGPNPSPSPGRRLNSSLPKALISAYANHPHQDRFHRAVTQYHHALQEWEPGSEIAALNHLWIGMEALTPIALRQFLGGADLSKERLAQKRVKLADSWEVDLKHLDAHVRRRLLFDDDDEAYDGARKASDAYEHGFEPLWNIRDRAVRTMVRTAELLRIGILKHSELATDVETVLLAPPFNKVFYPYSDRSMTGILEGWEMTSHESSFRFPQIDWNSYAIELPLDVDGDIPFGSAEHIVADLPAGVSFVPRDMEVEAIPPDDDGAAIGSEEEDGLVWEAGTWVLETRDGRARHLFRLRLKASAESPQTSPSDDGVSGSDRPSLRQTDAASGSRRLAAAAEITMLMADALYFREMALSSRVATLRSTAALVLTPYLATFLVEAEEFFRQRSEVWEPVLLQSKTMLGTSRQRIKLLDDRGNSFDQVLLLAQDLAQIPSEWMYEPHVGPLGPFKRWLQPDLGLFFYEGEVIGTTHTSFLNLGLDRDAIASFGINANTLGQHLLEVSQEFGSFLGSMLEGFDLGIEANHAAGPIPAKVGFRDLKSDSFYQSIALRASPARIDVSLFLTSLLSLVNAARLLVPVIAGDNELAVFKHQFIAAFHSVDNVQRLLDQHHRMSILTGEAARHLQSILKSGGARAIRKQRGLRNTLVHFGVTDTVAANLTADGFAFGLIGAHRPSRSVSDLSDEVVRCLNDLSTVLTQWLPPNTAPTGFFEADDESESS